MSISRKQTFIPAECKGVKAVRALIQQLLTTVLVDRRDAQLGAQTILV